MIIDPDPPKRPLSRRSVASFESLPCSEIHPPSYRSHGSISVQPMLDEEPPMADDDDMLKKPKKRRLEDRRCWKWLMYILIVYAVVSIAAIVPFLVTHRKDFRGPVPYQRMKPPDSASDPSDVGTIPVIPTGVPAGDGKVLACNNWDYTHNYGYPDNLKYSRLSWCIPRNAQSIFLHALNGPKDLVKGEFRMVPHPDDNESDYVIDIMVTYPSDDFTGRNSSAICLMQDGDEWGVGIYTPPNPGQHDLNYKITIFVPQTQEPAVLPQFSTFLPWFNHRFEDLNNTLIFENVQIGGVSSSVDGTLHGQTVNITTTEASITGNYGAQKSLVLQTSLGTIDTNITLGSDLTGPTNLFMKSSKGPFSATVNLAGKSGNSSLSSRDISPGVPTPGFIPEYDAQIQCDDSPITLVLRHDSTVDSSLLNVQVNTSLNRALVLLDSKFEGNFDLDAANSSVLVADLDGDSHMHPESFSNSFPEYYNSRRELQFYHRSESRASGCIAKRGPPGKDSTEAHATVNVNNRMGLVALGFIQPGQTSPILKQLDVTDLGLR